MDLKHQIGQHLVTGFPGLKMNEDFIKAVKEYKIGNVILFARNIESKHQLKTLIKDINALYEEEVGIKPFITIDQEGGMVTRLSDDCVNIPGAMALSATENDDYLDECTDINCRQLEELGINCNLAPVLDVNCNKNNPVIGTRSYSDEPEEVSRIGRRIIQGYRRNKFLCVAKHFPGHGDTALDSHLSLPTVKKSMKELEKMELLPFKEAILNDIPAIMTSHILYPSLEKQDLPATMSHSIITDFLRNTLNFRGLVFSDDMEMNAIKNYYGTVDGAITSLKAGADLLFVSHHPLLAVEVCSKILEAYNKGEFDDTLWNESTERIEDFKRKYVDVKTEKQITESDKTFVYKVKRESLSLVKGSRISLGDNPLFVSPQLFQATNVSSDFPTFSFSKEMIKYIPGKSITCSSDPKGDEIKQWCSSDLLNNATSVIFASYNAHLYKGQLELAKQMKKENIPFASIALRNPYDLSPLNEISDISIAAYEYTADIVRLIAEFFKGEFDITGHLPVNI